MHFGSVLGTACSTFAITNIDNLFVLVTFFAEASTSDSITAFSITLGQYLGFSVVVLISMIGYAVALVLPAEPIGFMGLLPILLGVWKALHHVFPSYLSTRDGSDDEELGTEDNHDSRAGESSWSKFRRNGVKGMFSVALMTILNGGDNVGTYIPLFSQAKGAEIAVYVIVYYILLGIWILMAWLIMKQKHILRVAEKWAHYVVPFLYVGLGTFIIVKSECYPWSVEMIGRKVGKKVGRISMGISTAVALSVCIAVTVWLHWRKRSAQRNNNQSLESVQERAFGGDEMSCDEAKIEGFPGQVPSTPVARL